MFITSGQKEFIIKKIFSKRQKNTPKNDAFDYISVKKKKSIYQKRQRRKERTCLESVEDTYHTYKKETEPRIHFYSQKSVRKRDNVREKNMGKGHGSFTDDKTREAHTLVNRPSTSSATRETQANNKLRRHFIVTGSAKTVKRCGHVEAGNTWERWEPLCIAGERIP